MISYETLLLKYEQLIQEQFKVKNPYLLKTGTLGTLINLFAHQELDLLNYYNKLFQETHPALAQDFNSMLFHANFYDVPVNFSQPAFPGRMAGIAACEILTVVSFSQLPHWASSCVAFLGWTGSGTACRPVAGTSLERAVVDQWSSR